MSIKKRAVHGIAWVVLITIIVRILNFLTKIVLAKLLVPEDFGLIAIGLLAINTMGIFRDLGFGAALIYKKDNSSNYALSNTAFIAIPVVSTFLFIIAYLFAPYIASFYGDMVIEPVVKMLALTFVISSFGTVPSMLLEKELEFKKKVLPEIIPTIGYAFVTIILALYGYGIWSLVCGQIIFTVLMVILLWIVSSWRPTFKFDWEIAKEMFKYSKHIMGASIVIFLITNIDNAIIGKILGLEALGFYTLAYTLANLPATQITHLVGRVMFPVYSKLQDDRRALGCAYLKTLKYVLALSIPAVSGIIIIAPCFVNEVLGEKWMPAIPALQILCIFGLSRSIAATTGSVFQASGRPDILLKTSFFQLILMIILIYLLIIPYGIAGVSLAVTIPIILQAILQIYIVSKIVCINFSVIYKPLFLICLSSILMTICLFLIIYIGNVIQINSIINLIISILLGTIIYILSLIIFDKNFFLETKSIISSLEKNP